MEANSIRELVKVRDRLDAWRETAQRSVDYSERPGLRIRSRNLVTNYEALIKQLNAVIEVEMDFGNITCPDCTRVYHSGHIDGWSCCNVSTTTARVGQR
jgi:NMD protein affecting ribosome stability and mRNA decay